MNIQFKNMPVFTVITEDRHYDVDVELFLTESDAIERAKQIAKNNMHSEEDYEEHLLNANMVKDGWLLYITYSCEVDCVKVLKRELK